ncbi:MAG: hypothetical protein K8R45_14480, partial [Desulfobacterales bacterium]|nr:hypothetical protein [Desulfobacterales bacterium]
LFTQNGQEVPPKELSPGLGQAVELLANILSSGDQIIITAIMHNLHAFSNAVDYRDRAEERILKLEEECGEFEKRVADLEDAIIELKKGEAA